MAHHNDHEDEAADYLAAFAALPEVLQSAALNLVRAAQALPDEQAMDTRTRLDDLVRLEDAFTGAPGQFVTAAAMVLEAHHDKLRADNP